jgi:hypothetical protein
MLELIIIVIITKVKVDEMGTALLAWDRTGVHTDLGRKS